MRGSSTLAKRQERLREKEQLKRESELDVKIQLDYRFEKTKEELRELKSEVELLRQKSKRAHRIISRLNVLISRAPTIPNLRDYLMLQEIQASYWIIHRADGTVEHVFNPPPAKMLVILKRVWVKTYNDYAKMLVEQRKLRRREQGRR